MWYDDIFDMRSLSIPKYWVQFFFFIQVDIYAGSLFLYEAVGWNIYLSAAVILVITAVYTLLGKIGD